MRPWDVHCHRNCPVQDECFTCCTWGYIDLDSHTSLIDHCMSKIKERADVSAMHQGPTTKPEENIFILTWEYSDGPSSKHESATTWTYYVKSKKQMCSYILRSRSKTVDTTTKVAQKDGCTDHPLTDHPWQLDSGWFGWNSWVPNRQAAISNTVTRDIVMSILSASCVPIFHYPKVSYQAKPKVSHSTP